MNINLRQVIAAAGVAMALAIGVTSAAHASTGDPQIVVIQAPTIQGCYVTYDATWDRASNASTITFSIRNYQLFSGCSIDAQFNLRDDGGFVYQAGPEHHLAACALLNAGCRSFVTQTWHDAAPVIAPSDVSKMSTGYVHFDPSS